MFLVFASTRAEFIKMAPLIKEMEKARLPFNVFSTGQHNLNDLSKKFKIEVSYLTEPPKKDESSRFGFSKMKALKWAFKLFFKINDLFGVCGSYYDQDIIDYVVVHGDTLSTALVSIVSWLNGVQVIHIESGLNSFAPGLIPTEPFPEEMCRRIAIKIAKYHFAPTKEAVNNLKGKKNVYFVGNTIYDTLKSYNLNDKSFKKRKNKGYGTGNYVIASIHRQENMNSEERMHIIVNAMNYCNRKVIFFAHDPFIEALKQFDLKLNGNVEVRKLASHKEFIKYLVNCIYVLGDGGSIQEECAYFNKPYVMMRAYTERKELYTQPGASKKIVKVLKTLK